MEFLDTGLEVIKWLMGLAIAYFAYRFREEEKARDKLESELGDRIDRLSGRAKDNKCELYKRIKEVEDIQDSHMGRMREMNMDQYAKIHKINEDLSKLHAHVAEDYLMKDDYDRLEKKCGE